jgi:hypothetical protein
MVVVALRGPRIEAPPNVIATLIRRHFNGLRGPPVVGTPNATHEGIARRSLELAKMHFTARSLCLMIAGALMAIGSVAFMAYGSAVPTAAIAINGCATVTDKLFIPEVSVCCFWCCPSHRENMDTKVFGVSWRL